MPVEIRSMVPSDGEAFIAIHAACLRRSLLGRYSERQIELWAKGRKAEKYVQSAKKGENFLVAVDDATPVGFVSWKRRDLLALFVHPDRQEQGIGQALARECFRRAEMEGCPITKLKAALGAESFYERFGFKAGRQGYVIRNGARIPYTEMLRGYEAGVARPSFHRKVLADFWGS